MAAESAILLKDILGEKTDQGRIAGLLKSSAKTVCRGELLLTLPRVKVVPRKDGKKTHNYQLASNPSITLCCTVDDVAPMSDYEYHLMAAVKSREARYQLFQKDVLDWGSKLKEGTFVYVTLPSKSPVSGQCVVSVIRYIGPLPNEHGIQFGVEIQEEQYRHQGSSNGLFGGEQYFECEDYCALFVSLDRLTPMAPVQQGPQPELPPFTDPQRLHQMKTRSQNKTLQSDLDRHGRRDHSPKQPRPHYKINDRVVVHNKRGVGIHGTVKWIEEVNFAGDKLIGVGIETDIAVQSKDFDAALHGLSQHFKCTDSSHGKIVVPESMVVSEAEVAAKCHKQKIGDRVDAHEHAHAQFRDVAQQREDEYLNGASHTQSGKIDREQQIHLMREIEKTHKGKKQNVPDNQLCNDPYCPQGYYEAISGAADSSSQPSYQQPSCPPDSNEQRKKTPIGSNSARPRVHTYDPNATRQELQAMRDQRSIQGYHQVSHRSGGGGGNNIPLHHQRSVPGSSPDYECRLSLHQPQDEVMDGSCEKNYGLAMDKSHSYPNLPSKDPDEKKSSATKHTSISPDPKTRLLMKNIAEMMDVAEYYEKSMEEQNLKVQQLNNEIMRLNDELQQASIKAEQQTIDIITKAGENNILEERLEKKQQEIIQFEEERRQSEAHFSQQLKEQQDQHQQVKTLLQQELQEVRQQCTQFQQQLHEAADQIEQLRAHLQHQLREQQDQHQQFQKDLREARQQSTHLQQQLREAADERQQFQARVETAVAFIRGDPLASQVGYGAIELWEIPREDVDISNKILGTGGWGYVAEGTFCGQKVAVKCLHRGILSQFTTNHVRREISIMAQVRHPNLVLLIGAVLNVDTGPLIITELLNRTLRSAYEDHALEERCELPILRDVACALNYLHTHRRPIIHRDVSSSNVLLLSLCDGNWLAKLSDFGSANLIRTATTPAEGAVIYSAPEVTTEQHGPQTTKVDVYSFGVLVCEVTVRRLPPDPKDFPAYLDTLERDADNHIYQLAKNCTKRNPEERLTMHDVLVQIDEFL